MTVPQGYTLYTWFNEVVGNLNDVNGDFMVFQKYWSSFTPTQKAQIKALLTGKIDTAITTLGLIKTEINNVPAS
jgi:hypothetical protein